MITANQEGQFEKVLHNPEQWYIDRIEFSEEELQLDVFVKFRKRVVFPCPDCGSLDQPVNDIALQYLSHVTAISTDETLAKRGHDYITAFMDTQKRNVIHVTKGKDTATWKSCKKH